MKKLTLMIMLTLIVSFSIAQTPNLDRNRSSVLEHLVGIQPHILLQELNRCDKSELRNSDRGHGTRWIEWYDKSIHTEYRVAYDSELPIIYMQIQTAPIDQLNNYIDKLSDKLVADQYSYGKWRDYTFLMTNPRTSSKIPVTLLYDLYNSHPDGRSCTYLLIHWDIPDED